MRKAQGASVLSFVMALGIVGTIIAISATIGTGLVRESEEANGFTSAALSIFEASERALVDEWQESGCRSFDSPPTLTTLVSDYGAPPSILTTAYTFTVDYHSSPTTMSSGGISVTAQMPEGISGFKLGSAAKTITPSVEITQTQVRLYRGVSTITSELEHQSIDAETGCRQEIE